jgi:hypothetical protein
MPSLGPGWPLHSYRSGLQPGESLRSPAPARFLDLLCPLLTSPTRSGSITLPSAVAGTGEISRGKARRGPCVDAGFTTYAPLADGGLHGHVPARPGRTKPHIRFLFVAPHVWIGLPSDPASRRRPCPSPNLRLRVHLVRGLPPRSCRAMPGTHVRHQPPRVSADGCMPLCAPSMGALHRGCKSPVGGPLMVT